MGLHEKYAKQGFLELVDVFTKEEAATIYSGYTNYVERYLCEDPKRDKENIFGKVCLLKSYILILRSGLEERDAWKVTSGKS